MTSKHPIGTTAPDRGQPQRQASSTVVHAERTFDAGGAAATAEEDALEPAGFGAEEGGLPARASRGELQQCARRLGVSEDQALHIAVKQLHEELFEPGSLGDPR